MLLKHRSQSGFTLVEMSIVVALIALLSMPLLSNMSALMRFKSSTETDNRLKDIHQAITAAYRDSAFDVESTTNQQLVLANGTISQALPDANGVCASTAATFAPLARFTALSPDSLHRDGGGAPMCIYITSRLSEVVAGTTVYYHTVAVVSPGPNGIIDSGGGCTTELSGAGVLTLCSDDTGVVVDGYAIQKENYERTVRQITRIVDAYASYFQSRYLADTSRDVSRDYFATTGTTPERWDSGGTMPNTGCAAFQDFIQASSPSPHVVLGLADADVTDPYANVIQYDNCSNSVRNPDNADASMRASPYTAIIRTTLPGNVVYLNTVAGTF